MTVTLYAQPYDLAATGFYFESHEAYCEKSAKLWNAHGDPVEEFEIQFIDGTAIDGALAEAIGLTQANLAQFFACVGDWDAQDKLRVIVAVGECGDSFEADTHPDDFEVDIYEMGTLRELAEQFVEDELCGDLFERLHVYIDFDAIAQDLALDYSETEIAGQRLIYRCG